MSVNCIKILDKHDPYINYNLIPISTLSLLVLASAQSMLSSVSLTLSETSPGFYVSAVQAF